ncbi:anaphase-promoting complex subunit 5 [Venturia canescens]|uniref:anaphase-promoting complex subunit 5 n=1 Tax=Venturia canescens TaxID=32260 RepID=UPI001C9BEE26|nr:anaphase-promoting complex subunit 5 [Venturia canescens]
MEKEALNLDDTSNKLQQEILTPYKVAVIMLIKDYCYKSVKVIIERRDFCIAALKLIQMPDMELIDLLKMLRSPEYTLQRFALQLEFEMAKLCETGIEGLLELFDSLTRLMKPSHDHSLSPAALYRNSVLGIYVRRIIVIFEQLPFFRVVKLYESFCAEFEIIMDQDLSNSISSLKKEESLSKKNVNVWGGRQAELLVAQQAHALQTDEHKAMAPSELQALIRELLSCNPYYAEAHYLSYLNCLRVNEYCGALDSLYHCFDRLAPLENRSAPEDRARTFRYAALNLAALHAQFGHKKVAEAALKEAVMMAQEAGDNVCLQLAHAWMYHLTNDKKGPLIERSVGKASMLGITHTTSLGLIASGHNSALEGKTPPHVFETLIKSDVVNCQHSMMDLLSMTYAEKSALWAYYGKTEMSSVCAQLLLLRNGGDKKQHMFNGPSTCQGLINVANMLVEFGEYNLVEVVIGHAKERFPNEPSNKIWMLSEQVAEFTKMMRHEKWSEAETIAAQISSLDPLESKFRQAEVCLAKADFSTAFENVRQIERLEDISPDNRVRAMILSSQIMSSSILPGTGTTGTNSLVLLNSALEMSTRNYLSYYEAEVKMHLANIQLLMGMPNQASNLVDEAIVQILAHGGWYDQARALVLYAKCLLATAPLTGDERMRALKDAIKALVKAQNHFDKVEAFGRKRSTLYLLSIIYHEIDAKDERNQCAFQYRQLHLQYPAKLDYIKSY